MAPLLPAASIGLATGAALSLLGLGWVAVRLWRWLKWANAQPLVTDQFWSDRRDEPGWTEQFGGRGRLRFGRAFSVNDHLMHVDAMARRGEIGAGGGD